MCAARRFVWMLGGLTALLLLSAAGPAQAQTLVNPAGGCPQTLSSPGEYVLTGDLACTGAVSGIVIEASDVVLHLAGHTISNATCDATQTFAGIFVVGGTSRVRIDGGTVSGFNDGIVLSSSASRVRGVTVSGACAFGILVGGENNRIDTNVVTASGSDGIILGPARGTLVTANDTSRNRRAGIAISDAADGNTVRANISNHNGGTGEGYGIAIFNGSNALIVDNVANGNDVGLRLSGSGSRAERNTVNGSVRTGVWITADGAPSAVRYNIVLGSRETDMLDDSPNCATNLWRRNRFQTDVVADVPDGGPGVGCIE